MRRNPLWLLNSKTQAAKKHFDGGVSYDGVKRNRKMFLCNKSLLNLAERVFVDVDIKPAARGKPFETWGAKHNLRTSIDRCTAQLRMAALRKIVH
ncbi:Hypothetical protein, putative [Bodo saltans]|uniref:Uncharacterized protein n=1 Tax=Bodo saltans TaxID=75058 RepID=A0A0S4KIX1_BODSA|nr:Hypothetical protein, putative [Bodo saltans]|eukprot:CUI14238.1 Hypothetical protein, putative [Bodo saltans]